LLRVDPEPRFLNPSLKTGLGAAERVNQSLNKRQNSDEFKKTPWRLISDLIFMSKSYTYF
jgi:hypothetical protein